MHYALGQLLTTGCIIALNGVNAATAPLLCASTGYPAPPQKSLSQVRTATVDVPGQPIGVVYAPRYGDVAFASLTVAAQQNAILAVLDTSTFAPTVKHQIALPYTTNNNLAAQIALTEDERYLFVAEAEGGFILDAARLAAGESDAIVGRLNGTTSSQNAGDGAFGVVVTQNARYAFVVQEYGNSSAQDIGNIDVFRLRYGRHRVVSSKSIGKLDLNILVTNAVLSPDGGTLYAVSEQKAPGVYHGTISVIDVAALESSPDRALLSQALAGCGTVRITLCRDGKVAWTTNREENTLLAFDTARLVSDPDHSLLANVTVGTSPVGLTLAKGGTRILTADSARFGGTSGISVVDVDAALAGKGQDSVLGSIATGLFPRGFAVSPDGRTVLVADYSSSQIQSLDVETLP